jgi:hypothetical protein
MARIRKEHTALALPLGWGGRCRKCAVAEDVPVQLSLWLVQVIVSCLATDTGGSRTRIAAIVATSLDMEWSLLRWGTDI